MGKPSNRDQRGARDEVNQGVKVIDLEHDDGSENPKTVVLENIHKKASSGQVQIQPSGNHKQSEDVSLGKEQCEIKVVATQSAQRHSSQDGMDYSCGGEKFLRGNVSDAFNSGEKHGPESVKQKQGASIASNASIDQAVVNMADDKKTCHEFEDPSKNTTLTSPRQPPTLTPNFKKDQKQEASISSRNCVEKAVVHIADGNKTHSEFTDASKKIPPTNPRQPHTRNSKKDKTQINSMSGILKTKGKFSTNSSWRTINNYAVLSAFAKPVFGVLQSTAMWIFILWLFSCIPLAHGFSTHELGCSVAGSRRDDGVLDALDVVDGREKDGRKEIFHGSGRGYTQICSTAFHDVEVNEVNLQNNSLSTFPNGTFDHTAVPVEIVDISDNNFVEFSSALNTSNHVIFLNVSKNMIEYIPGGTMNGMEGLSTVDFSCNEAMEQVPEDTFYLMKHSLKRVILTKTKVKHPLVPPPQDMVCTKDNPCIVTNEEGGVSIETNGSKVTFYIEAVACEGVKQQLEADYEVLEGEVSCENNVLIGTIKIVRKGVSDAGTTYEPNQPDLTTTIAPSTDTGTDLGKTQIPTTGIYQDTGVDTPSSIGEQSDLTNDTTEVTAREGDQGISLSKVEVVAVVFAVFVVGGCIGALLMGYYCYCRASSKMRPAHTTNGTLGGNPSDQPHTESPTPQNIEESQF